MGKSRKETGKIERRTRLFSGTDEAYTKKEILEQSRRSGKERAKLSKMREALKEIERTLETAGPHLILWLNDEHYASDASDYEYMDEFISIIRKFDAKVILLGDEVEGTKDYPTISGHRTGSTDQDIEDFQTHILDQINEHVLAAVGGYFGHPGWVNMEVWRIMFDDYGIPIIQNAGGRVVLHHDGHTTRIDNAHYFKGRGNVDTLSPVRAHAKIKKGENRPDATAQGHTHQAAVGVEHYPSAVKPLILVQSGTFKGINPDLPRDPYGPVAGFSTEPAKAGQGLILLKSGNRIPVSNLSKADFLFSAFRFSDEQNSLAIEAAEMALDNDQSQTVKRTKKSVASIQEEQFPTRQELEKMRQRREKEDEDDENGENAGMHDEVIYANSNLAPLHQRISYNRITDMPDLIFPIANLREGSSYSGIKELKKMLNDFLLGNPHVFFLFLSNVIDKDVPKSHKRLDVLDNLVTLIEEIGPNQVLALMLDGVMRSQSWRKQIGYDAFVPPGTYVSNETGVPLVPGGSVLEISHGPQDRADRKTTHKIGLLDGLQGLGSHSKALQGLASYQINHDHEGLDAFITGHHNHSGAGTYIKDGAEIDFVDVGHFSAFDNTGGNNKNVRQTADAGQGLVIYKDTRFVTDSWETTKELFFAVFAFAAARKYGVLR